MLTPNFAPGFAASIIVCAIVLIPASLESKHPSETIVIASGPLMLIGAVAFGIGGQFSDPSALFGVGAALCLASSCILAAAGLTLLARHVRR